VTRQVAMDSLIIQDGYGNTPVTNMRDYAL
jgi:hypothetical protein